MRCSGGAATLSPADSDPLGFSVDPKTGAITGTPQRVRDGYQMRLRAVDADNAQITVANWSFNVKHTPAFSLRKAAGWDADEPVDRLADKYHVNETHLLARPRLTSTELLQNSAGGDYGKVVYLLSAEAAGANPSCASKTRAISALTDVVTGEGAINVQCVGNYTATLVARDGGGEEVVLRNWSFEVLPKDTSVPAYGPGGRGHRLWPCLASRTGFAYRHRGDRLWRWLSASGTQWHADLA